MHAFATVAAIATALLPLVSASPVELESRQSTKCTNARSFGPYLVTHVPANNNLSTTIAYPGDVLQWAVYLGGGSEVGVLPNGTLRWYNYLYETGSARPSYVGSPRAKGAYQIIPQANFNGGSTLTSQFSITANGLTSGKAYTMGVASVDGQGKVACPDVTSFRFTYQEQRPSN
ncbi:hypothetical protein V8E36_002260 [Tilletia maclaganii]